MRCEWTEEALATEVAATRFALIELTLFLDTHPDDKAALSAFCEYRDRYAELAGKYAANFAPLTVSDVNGQNGWTWGSTPMPHEGGL